MDWERRRAPTVLSRVAGGGKGRAMTFRIHAIAAAVLLAGLTPGAGAADKKPVPQVSEETRVTLVEVPVNVTDKAGNPVENLKAEDFEITDDGKKQEITGFEVLDQRKDIPRVAGAEPDQSGRAPSLHDRVRSLVRNSEGDRQRPARRPRLRRHPDEGARHRGRRDFFGRAGDAAARHLHTRSNPARGRDRHSGLSDARGSVAGSSRVRDRSAQPEQRAGLSVDHRSEFRRDEWPDAAYADLSKPSRWAARGRFGRSTATASPASCARSSRRRSP